MNQFLATQTDPSLNSIKNAVKQNLLINWNTTSWQDLTKPLYSGLAAAMYLYTLTAHGSVVPSGIEYQAVFWKNTTRPSQEVSVFYGAANKLETGTVFL